MKVRGHLHLLVLRRLDKPAKIDAGARLAPLLPPARASHPPYPPHARIPHLPAALHRPLVPLACLAVTLLTFALMCAGAQFSPSTSTRVERVAPRRRGGGWSSGGRRGTRTFTAATSKWRGGGRAARQAPGRFRGGQSLLEAAASRIAQPSRRLRARAAEDLQRRDVGDPLLPSRGVAWTAALSYSPPPLEGSARHESARVPAALPSRRLSTCWSLP